MGGTEGMFTILFACTGNRCRSPYAHAALARLVRDLPVEVLSAGTLDAPGETVPPELIEIAAGAELDLSTHRARHLAPGEWAHVDLFLGFERAHVAAAVVDAGIDSGKAFTLPEFVRLLGEIEAPPKDDLVERARASVTAADEVRHSGASFVPGEEVSDPFRRSRQVYERSAAEIEDLCGSLHELLFRREPGA